MDDDVMLLINESYDKDKDDDLSRVSMVYEVSNDQLHGRKALLVL